MGWRVNNKNWLWVGGWSDEGSSYDVAVGVLSSLKGTAPTCTTGDEECTNNPQHTTTNWTRVNRSVGNILSFCFLSFTPSTYPLRYRELMLHLITHTHTFGMILPDEGSARHREVYLMTHNIHKRQDIHVPPPAEFAPATPAIQRSQTRVLECAATGIGREVFLG